MGSWSRSARMTEIVDIENESSLHHLHLEWIEYRWALAHTIRDSLGLCHGRHGDPISGRRHRR